MGNRAALAMLHTCNGSEQQQPFSSVEYRVRLGTLSAPFLHSPVQACFPRFTVPITNFMDLASIIHELLLGSQLTPPPPPPREGVGAEGDFPRAVISRLNLSDMQRPQTRKGKLLECGPVEMGRQQRPEAGRCCRHGRRGSGCWAADWPAMVHS